MAAYSSNGNYPPRNCFESSSNYSQICYDTRSNKYTKPQRFYTNEGNIYGLADGPEDRKYSDGVRGRNTCCEKLKENAASLHVIIELLNRDLSEAHQEINRLKIENQRLEGRIATSRHREHNGINGWPIIQSDQWQKPHKPLNSKNREVNCLYEVPTFNRFDVLQDSRPSKEHNLTPRVATVRAEHVTKSAVLNTVQNSKKIARKVFIFADSQGRGISDKLSDNMKNTTVCGVVKPGAPMRDVVSSVGSQCKDFTQSDCVVIIGGSNNQTKNEGNEVIACLKETLPKLCHTNVVVVNVPHRYDLHAQSDTNKATTKCNSRIEKLCKHFRNTTLVDTFRLGRSAHTTHGLHLNHVGKTEIAKVISTACKEMANVMKKESITLKWKDAPQTNSPEELESKNGAIRKSERVRKTKTLHADFL